MGIEENKEVVREWFERSHSGNISEIDKFISDSLVMHGSGTGRDNVVKEELKQGLENFYATFPDVKGEIEDMIAEGDKVMVRATITGTNTGNHPDRPPTGKRISMPRYAVYRLEKGKIAEIWYLDGLLRMYQQLGVTPPPPPTKEIE